MDTLKAIHGKYVKVSDEKNNDVFKQMVANWEWFPMFIREVYAHIRTRRNYTQVEVVPEEEACLLLALPFFYPVLQKNDHGYCTAFDMHLKTVIADKIRTLCC